jgi:hypothetical protein
MALQKSPIVKKYIKMHKYNYEEFKYVLKWKNWFNKILI